MEKKWLIGCVGCGGAMIILTLLFGGCVAFFVGSDTGEPQTEKSSQEETKNNNNQRNDEVEKKVTAKNTSTSQAPKKNDAKVDIAKEISAKLNKDDEVQYTKETKFVFIQARAVSEKETVAREKLYRTVKTISEFYAIDKATINVQSPDGSRLLYKYTISGDKLRAIDFKIPGYGPVFEAADALNSTY